MIIYLLFLHFLGDFFLQTRRIALTKSIFLSSLLIHLITLSTVFIIGLWFFVPHTKLLYFVAGNAAIHGLIDWFIWKLYKASIKYRYYAKVPIEFKYYEDRWFYNTIAVDQFLHISTLIVLWSLI